MGVVTHGKTQTPEFRAWHDMLQRCLNPKNCRFSDYGARGITVCERWMKFENFLEDMGVRPSPGHSLDRYPNNDGRYEPSNCRWATRSEQQRNKRRPRTNRLPRGDAHWTRQDKERALQIARANIRKTHKPGEANNNAKLTRAKADEIRRYRDAHPLMRMEDIGRLFGIGREQTRKIVKGLVWQ